MAKPRTLKVYRTPIGFHDAYVAAPSQKAALEAWGSGHDLFARGEAELVTDPALTEEPLRSPGAVIKQLRGTADEQVAALGADRSRKATPKHSPRPRPDRNALDTAEVALGEADKRYRKTTRALMRREAGLERERREAAKAHDAETVRLERTRNDAQAAYERAMAAWRG